MFGLNILSWNFVYYQYADHERPLCVVKVLECSLVLSSNKYVLSNSSTIINIDLCSPINQLFFYEQYAYFEILVHVIFFPIFNLYIYYFSVNQQRLIQLEEEAKSQGKGRWGEGASKHVRDITWVIENPRNFVDSFHNKPIDGKLQSNIQFLNTHISQPVSHVM